MGHFVTFWLICCLLAAAALEAARAVVGAGTRGRLDPAAAARAALAAWARLHQWVFTVGGGVGTGGEVVPLHTRLAW